MFDRETIFRLSVGAVIAVLVHLLLLPTLWGRVLSSAERLVAERAPEPVRPTPAEQLAELTAPEPEPRTEEPSEEIPVGQDVSPLKTSLAWISYEDFQKLVAPRSETVQPALQSKVDPTPEAPLPLEPTPAIPVTPQASAAQAVREPTPTAEPSRAVEAASPAPVESAATPIEQVASEAPPELEGEPIEQLAALPPRAIAGPADLEGVTDSPGEAPIAPRPQVDATGPEPSKETPVKQDEARAPDAAEGQPMEQEPAEAVREREQAEPTPAEPAREQSRPAPEATPAQANPTSAPRSEAEAPPTDVNEQPERVHAGGVIAAEGIRIITAQPVFSVVTRASTIPKNPLVRVTFNAQGVVTKAQILRSSGSENVDGPILASLYKWRAEGEHLSKVKGEFSKTIEILLTR